MKISEERKEYMKKWREANKDYQKKWREANKNKVTSYNYGQIDKAKSYYYLNREQILKKKKEYRLKNKKKISDYNKKYEKERKKIDIVFKLKINIKTAIKNSFRQKGYIKNNRTYEILGCSFQEFKLHLESKFESWMNWENYGKYNGELNYGWDIDHIIPLASATTESDVIKLNHFSNLQPLCSYVNRYIKIDN